MTPEGVAIELHAPLHDVTEAWDALADAAGSPPWLRPGWFDAWSEAFGSTPARVAVVRDAGRIVAVAPLASRGRVAASLTNYHTPAWGIVAADDAARRAMAEAIMADGPARVSLQFVPASGPDREPILAAADRSRRRVLTRVLEHCPVVDTTVGWEAFEASLRGHFRRELRRRAKGLERTGTVVFEVLTHPDDLDGVLDEGFAVEAAGWKGERGTAINSQPATEAFYRAIARWAAERGWLRLGFLRLDGRAIAFDFALEDGRVHALLKTGFDPELRRFAPGMLMRRSMLRHAFEAGVAQYLFLGHDDPWKREWTTATDDQLLIQAFSASPVGLGDWAAHRWGRPMAIRVRDAVKPSRRRSGSGAVAADDAGGSGELAADAGEPARSPPDGSRSAPAGSRSAPDHVGGWLTVAPPLDPRSVLPGRPTPLPFPLDRPEHRRYRQARHGLNEGLRALGLGPGHEVLVPAYHHGSEVEAIVRAGPTPVFYEATPDLAPDPAELERLLTPRTRVLHLVHYLGFPQDAATWRAWCDERGLLLVEDAAQAWLASVDGRPVGSWGDLAIFSLYKSEGVPDGGALLGPASVPEPPARAGAGLRGGVRRTGAFVAGRSDLVSSRLGARPRSEYDPLRDFALGEVSAPTAATERLIGRIDLGRVAERRRARYAVLLEHLGDRVPEPFRALPDGASPFAFPIVVDDKAAWLDHLARWRIRATDLWSVPHPALPDDRFQGAARRRSETLLLPVHQHLRRSDLARMVRAVRDGAAGP